MELFLLGAERANCLARVRTRSEAPCRARTGGKPGVRPPPIKKGQKSSIKNGAFFIGGGASHPGSPKMQHLWGGAAWLACGLEVKRHAGREPAGSPESARPHSFGRFLKSSIVKNGYLTENERLPSFNCKF